MEADLADAYRDARREGRRAAATLWLRTLPSLARTGLAQHLDGFARDGWFALRLMSRSPAFTGVAVVMIALGTGANAAILSITDAVLLRSPFAEPDRLVEVEIERANGRTTAAVTRAQYEALREHGSVFQDLGALGSSRAPILSGVGEPQRFRAECVTASTFRVLGTPLLSGRAFSAAEERAGAPVAVISDQFWLRVLGGAPGTVGREITLNGVPVTIIGIMPHGFAGPYSRDTIDGWLPIAMPPLVNGAGNRPFVAGNFDEAGGPVCVPQGTLNVFARLPAGISFGAGSY